MSEREALREAAQRVVDEARDFDMAGPLLVAVIALDAALAEAAPPSDKRSTWDKEVGWRRVPEAAPPSRALDVDIRWLLDNSVPTHDPSCAMQDDDAPCFCGTSDRYRVLLERYERLSPTAEPAETA